MAFFNAILSPARHRVQPLPIATTVILRSDQNAFEGVATAIAATTTVTLPTGASTVNSFYNGLYLALMDRTAAASNVGIPREITGYVGATLVATYTPAVSATGTPGSVVIGRSLPPSWGTLYLSGAAGVVFYSFDVGGAADATRRFSLAGATSKLFTRQNSEYFDYIELQSTAGDNITIEWS